LPAECDVSIRPGWFWHEAENARVKKTSQLVNLYYQSVGRGATLLLNVPPNRDGLISAEDAASLKAFGAYLSGTFVQNLAAHAKADASHVRGNDKQFGPAHLLDGKPDTYWATDDRVTSADVTLDLGHAVKFQVIRLREAIAFGQRVDAFTVERWQSDSWEPVATSTSIGPRRLIRLDSPIIATRLRLRITQASASPALSEFAVFSEANLG
jgi:alpha-L-fucosidase